MTRPVADERGAVVPLTALALVATLIMVAIVIDLGATRATRGRARSTADAAASAGALDLGAANATTACASAFGYAYLNLGGSQPTNDAITLACAGMAAACTAASPARVATLPVGNRTVRVTNPVPDTDPLLRAKAVGISVNQAANATADGAACQRLGVDITQPQSRFFGGVASSASGTFRIQSVARYTPTGGGSLVLPALVALNQTACKAIDTGNGDIWVESTSTGPGIVHSDSDGTSPLCSGGTGILDSGSSGSLRAAGLASAPGELAWYSAPPSRGYVNGNSTLENGTTASDYSYVGRLSARSTRTTRTPADAAYHCTNIPGTPTTPVCTTPDPVKDADTLAQAAVAPSGFTAYTGPCDTDSVSRTFSINTFVSCATFEVKKNPLIVSNGATIIFTGRLDVASNGTLAVNVTTPGAAPGANGLPVAAVPAAQSRLIVGSTAANAVSISSNSSTLNMAQTFLYSRGGFNLQASNGLRWSPPTSGPTKSLLYWSDAAQPFHIQGGPAIAAAGVLFQGNGTLSSGGGGTIDLTNVQAWVDTVSISGSGTIKLKPDPANSIKLPERSGSALIR